MEENKAEQLSLFTDEELGIEPDPIKRQIEAVKNKIPKEWGKWISCGEGWYEIIINLDKQLTYLMPNYEPHQIKEKYAGLRFYWAPTEPVEPIVYEIAEACVDAAEREADNTCEECGAKKHRAGNGIKHDETVAIRADGPGLFSYMRTLCKPCGFKLGFLLNEEEEKEFKND